jgi:hypothetical protein
MQRVSVSKQKEGSDYRTCLQQGFLVYCTKYHDPRNGDMTAASHDPWSKYRAEQNGVD